jgi:pimeloyl-ACP methyl ester carboxylesterase
VFLARSFQVVTLDPRGNGRSGRPTVPEELELVRLLEDAWDVLDVLGIQQAVLAGVCGGSALSVLMAAERPERVLGVFAINPGLGLTPPLAHKLVHDFEEELDTEEGWAKNNRHYWRRDWPGFARFFFGEMFPEPHSTKQVEDCVAWATDTTPEVMLLDAAAAADPRLVGDGAVATCRGVRCPVLVVTGSLDNCQHPDRGRVLAELTGGELVVIDGGGHLPQARDPVKVNLLLRDFVRRVAATDRSFADA